MANNIMETYPRMIKGYAFPIQNSTDCDYSGSWVEDNDLPLYAPMDSGATAVAYYGGFGMPDYDYNGNRPSFISNYLKKQFKI